MIPLKEAKKKALAFDRDLKCENYFDDGEYYVFGYGDSRDICPVGVNKKTGEAGEYFPWEHEGRTKRAQ
ncbi:MAG: hypothetical protein IJF98_04395 [Firmicutes bacterium]|nr:hypothetical protein [Bacillota bacterium]